MNLAIKIRVHCYLWESIYWPQAMLLWMPCKSRGKWPVNQWNTAMFVMFALPLSCSLIQDGLNDFVYWAAGHYMYLHVKTAVHLLQSHSFLSFLQTECGNPRLLLPCIFFSRQATGYLSLPSEPKSKHYQIGGLSLQREDCVVSVAQAPLGLVILAVS